MEMHLEINMRQTLNCSFCGKELDKSEENADQDDLNDVEVACSPTRMAEVIAECLRTGVPTKVRCPKCFEHSGGMRELLPIWLKYQEHRKAYEQRTSHFSRVVEEDPDYQAIIAMGEPVVKFILLDFIAEDLWHAFVALALITDENPITEEHRGRLPDMALDWIEWGRENEYV
jgi:hypothetical protein